MLEVVAALIEDGEHVLLCQRPEGKARALLWEFPGGKIEPGETKQERLRANAGKNSACICTSGRNSWS